MERNETKSDLQPQENNGHQTFWDQDAACAQTRVAVQGQHAQSFLGVCNDIVLQRRQIGSRPFDATTPVAASSFPPSELQGRQLQSNLSRDAV